MEAASHHPRGALDPLQRGRKCVQDIFLLLTIYYISSATSNLTVKSFKNLIFLIVLSLKQSKSDDSQSRQLLQKSNRLKVEAFKGKRFYKCSKYF